MHTTLNAVEFSRWLEDQAHPLGERWFAGIRARDAMWSDGVEELVEQFVTLFLQLLPPTVGRYREQVEPLWLQAAELFGSFAAQRGLAAGEVIEEFQILREAVIRLLWADPPPVGTGRIALREALRLNRVLDRGTTQASVGHTDALFFALFQGSGVPETLTDDVRYEVRHQLQAIEAEFRAIVRPAG